MVNNMWKWCFAILQSCMDKNRNHWGTHDCGDVFVPLPAAQDLCIYLFIHVHYTLRRILSLAGPKHKHFLFHRIPESNYAEGRLQFVLISTRPAHSHTHSVQESLIDRPHQDNNSAIVNNAIHFV